MHRRRRRSALATAIRTLLAAGGMFGAHGAWANCTTTGLATTCDANAPNPWTNTIGSGPSQAAGSSIVVAPNASIVLGNAAAISFADTATLLVSANATVQNSAALGAGPYRSQNDTVQFRDNSLMTVEAGARVLALGINTQAEAINPQGTGNTILNRGTIRADNAAAIWFQSPTGHNTIDNHGVIEGFGGTGNAFGGGGTLVFHNRETGVVRGNLIFGDGDDTLFLHTGSVLTGALHGRGGSDAITLDGAGTAALPGALDGFEFLTKRGSGTWELTGAIAGDMTVAVDAGTLRVSGNNTGFTGTMTVGAGATLLGNAQSLTPTITDHGRVRFQQDADGSYAGTIQGSGTVEKTGAGVLTLSGTNAYTGGTTLADGIVQVAGDAQLGNAAGALRFDGGTLRTTAGFALSRTTTLGAGGGAFETAAGSTLLHAGALSGSGALVKLGAGTLVLANDATFGGGTTITAGTLQLGNGSASGSVTGNVVDNGVLAFNRSGTFYFGGAISGDGQLHQLGSGTVHLTGTNTYTGGTLVGAGTLVVGDGWINGSIVGDVANNATLEFARSDGFTFGGRISGTGGVKISSIGTMVFTADHTYGGVTSVLGTLQLGNGGATGNLAGPVSLSGRLVLNRSDDFTFASAISGTGELVHAGTGTTVLAGASTATGATRVDAGRIEVDGTLAGPVTVSDGASLGGTGAIGGAVNVANGARLDAGGEGSAGTLRVGSLALASGASLGFDLGTPDIVGGGLNDLVVVDDDLVLDGTLHIADLGGFGARTFATATTVAPGVYRLFDYGGTLTDNGLDFGTLPAGIDAAALQLQTSVAGEVNLVLLDEDFTLQFWDGANETADGAIHGGDGTWDTSATRWTNTDGVVNTHWRGGFAVFQGTAGTVSLDEDIDVGGLQFATDGYRIDGNGFALRADAPVTLARVNEGVATIDAPIVDGAGGPARLVKTDDGVLVLAGTNTYSGGTTFAGGAVQVARDANLGAASGGLVFDDGALVTSASFASARQATLLDGGGTVAPLEGTTLVLSGTIDGAGTLRKTGAGTLVLDGTNTWTGGTRIDAGVLEVSADDNLGAAGGALAFDGGTLHVAHDILKGELFASNRPITLEDGGGVFDIDAGKVMTPFGRIDGSGRLTKTGAGTLVLADTTNAYAGGTSILGGTVRIARDSQLGAASGDVRIDGGRLHVVLDVESAREVTLGDGGGVFDVDPGVVLALDGVLDGTGMLTKRSAGTLVLRRDATHAGGTTIEGGTLQLGDGTGGTGSVVGDIANDGTLVFHHLDDVTAANAIHGTGAVVKRGDNTLTLTGDSTHTGLTTIEAGVLRIGDGGTRGALAGDVANQGELAFDRADAWTFAGAIAGDGAVRHLGSGMTTLAGANTYRGGTFLDAGVLRVTADAQLGDATGEVAFDGGTLRLDAAFDLARDVRVDLGGGTFDVATTNHIDGHLSGVGGLTKLGAGTLLVDRHADYAGATRVLQGTLIVGDSAHATTQLASGGRGVEVAEGAFFGGCGSVRATIRNAGTIGVCNALPALQGESGLQFSVLGELTNAGTVLLSNGTTGNRLVLDTYVADGGVLDMDVVLDAGGDAAQSDRLEAASVRLGAAPTALRIRNLGGSGAATTGAGIPLVEGVDPTQADRDAFVLAHRVVAGPFEYRLAYGNGLWSLQSDTPDAGGPLLRPEVGAYLGNRRAATDVLLHSLQDRPDHRRHVGEAWMRLLGGNVRADAAEGRILARGGRSLLQAGVDVAHFEAPGAHGRVHLGAMLGVSRADVDVAALHNPARASGTSEGVLGGVYGTWRADDARRLGPYLDTWVQLGRFDHAAAGETLAPERYDADAWAASAEFGYAWRVGTRWALEPQLQVVRTDYAGDMLAEANGTRVSALDARETTTRAGLRWRALDGTASPVVPYLEANWWHGGPMPSIAFNGIPVRGGVPADRYALEAGLSAELGHRLALFLQVKGEWGAHDYHLFQGQVGVRCRW